MEERDYILHKALALKAKNEICNSLVKIDKVCENYAEKIGLINKNLADALTVSDIAKFSKELKQKQDGFVSFLAVRNRAYMLLDRNEERIAYLSKILTDSGIYQETYDKKQFNEIVNSKNDISSELINLNCRAEGEIVYRYIDSYVFAFKGNLLDLNYDFNQRIFLNLDSSMICKIFKMYPNFVSTIPVSLWLNIGFKQMILKEMTGYVVEELKTKSISEINKSLGSLLSFKTEITSDAESYIAGVQNMIDVQTKDFLIKKYPDKEAEIRDKLKCNEKSELIPRSKRVSVFANGLAGDEKKDELQESEDVRIKKEMQEQQALFMLDDFLNLNFDVFDEESEPDKSQENLKQQQNEYEVRKLKDKSKEVEELEQSLQKSLTKHDD